MAETTASTLKDLPTKSFTSTANTWEGLQTFKDEVRIESSSDNGAIFRKFCDKLKVGETPSVGQNILIDQDCTKDWYVLHDHYVHVASNNDVSYAENIVPNLKYSSTEEREKHIFPIIRAVIDNSSNAGISIGSSKEEKESLGTTWINLYGDVYIHCNDRNDGYGNVSCLHFRNDGVAIEAKGYVNCGMAVHETNDGYELKNSYVAITEKESYTQYVERVYPNKKFSSDEERYNHSNIILNAVVDNNGDATIHVGVGNGSDNTTTSTTIFHGKAQCPTAPTADADLVNKKYVDDNKCNLKRTFTPLIDWEYENPTTFYTGVKNKWLYYSTNIIYRSIYDDGRFARFVYPLKQPFTDFEEIMICYPDFSGGTPDQSTSIFKTDVFDFLLNFPKNDNVLNTFCSVNIPSYPMASYEHLWVPYKGCASTGFDYDYQKSTPTRLMAIPSCDWVYAEPICEIYGIK